jgi:calmodulin
MFDVDGSGTIDREELRTVAASLGEVFTDDDIDELIKAADSDGDGEISIEEFCDLLLESITE